MEMLNSADFWIGLVKIIWINIILSGDNAVVIALAARSLPPEQQKKAIMFGSGAAVVLRIVLTVVAAKLLELSFLQVVGGCLLLWIGSALGRARLGWARRFLRQHRTRCQQQGGTAADHLGIAGVVGQFLIILPDMPLYRFHTSLGVSTKMARPTVCTYLWIALVFPVSIPVSRAVG